MSRHPVGVTVGVMPWQAPRVVDGYQEEATWGDPVLIEGCAVAPGQMVEPFEAGREGSSVAFTVYVTDPDAVVGFRDKVVLPGEEPFDVVGRPSDWGRNPFNGAPAGMVVLLGRFDG